MDQLQQLRERMRGTLLALITLQNVVTIGIDLLLNDITQLQSLPIAIISLVIGFFLSGVLVWFVSSYFLQPLQALWQVILHLSPTESAPPPVADTLKLGRELVTNLIAQLYQFLSVSQQTQAATTAERTSLNHNFVAQNLPLPLLVLDPTETISFVNEAAASYIGSPAEQIVGKNVYMVLDLSFPSEDTFDSWLKAAKTENATATKTWERVRLNVRDNHPTRLFDLAAYYNKDNPDKQETMLVLFDHTSQYSQDDQAISFIALSVHELRTPLTLLRGYIEVFEQELGTNLEPELHDFMLKMRSQAEQLTAFVNNILNVARVDDDQLELQLHEEDWSSVLKSAIEMMSLRAKVRGITLECQITKGLPAVGVDSLSIREVVSNLLDNAIKYSAASKVIKINSHLTQDGLVETTVQDFGVGIPSAVMPNLFTKFYRDHRNRAQIGGTGLGLYLSKAIVTAHGGNLWVQSKEGEGSTFGFTLLPYSQLAEAQKQTGNKEVTRSAQGWIKNHSLYRR